MTIPTVHWRKSTFSGGDNNACVELTGTLDAVRDSKNPDGPILRADLHGLLTALQDDRLNR